MTERLYFDDSYLCEWNARIVERTMLEEQAAVILDRSAFYPTGGGQPHDRGEIAVVRWSMYARGKMVLSCTSWRKRHRKRIRLLARSSGRDGWISMQHHSAQHILTQACVRELGVATIGFHLTEDNATIDLDRVVEDAEIDAAQRGGQPVVMENRAIHCAGSRGLRWLACGYAASARASGCASSRLPVSMRRRVAVRTSARQVSWDLSKLRGSSSGANPSA